jgi:ribosomal protein L3 glutamine methyltransferase
LIPAGFQPWLRPEEPLRALDLCTGSGCIAVAMAHYWPHWQIDAVDLSAAAVAQAAANCKIHKVSAKVRVIEGDLFEPCGAHQYDLIVTNPPYVGESEYAILPAEYRSEPALGLVAGEDGLDIVYRILSQAAGFLSERGILVCEVGYSQAALVEQMPHAPFMWFDFEHGGRGVFMLDRQQLVDLSGVIQQILRERTDVQ